MRICKSAPHLIVIEIVCTAVVGLLLALIFWYKIDGVSGKKPARLPDVQVSGVSLPETGSKEPAWRVEPLIKSAQNRRLSARRDPMKLFHDSLELAGNERFENLQTALRILVAANPEQGFQLMEMLSQDDLAHVNIWQDFAENDPRRTLNLISELKILNSNVSMGIIRNVMVQNPDLALRYLNQNQQFLHGKPDNALGGTMARCGALSNPDEAYNDLAGIRALSWRSELAAAAARNLARNDNAAAKRFAELISDENLKSRTLEIISGKNR